MKKAAQRKAKKQHARKVRIKARAGHVRTGEQSPSHASHGSQSAMGLYQEGIKLFSDGHWWDAEECFRRALEQTPDQPRLLYHRGLSLKHMKEIDESRECFQQLAKVAPTDERAPMELAGLCEEEEDWEEVEEYYRQALALRPESPDALSRFARFLSGRGYRVNLSDEAGYHDLEEARQLCDKALSLKPKGYALVALGGTLSKLNDYEGALRCFDEVLQHPPFDKSVRWNRGLTCLTLGDWRRGWEGYELRRDVHTAPTHAEIPPDVHRWTGKRADRPDRTLLIWHEQAFGDCLWMSRFFSLLSARWGGKVVVYYESGMEDLGNLVTGCEGIEFTDDVPEHYDAQLAISSFPFVFGTTPSGHLH